jgi:competence protein ComEC
MGGVFGVLIGITGLCWGANLTVEWPFFKQSSTHGDRIIVTQADTTFMVRMNDHVPYVYGDTVQLKGAIRECNQARTPNAFDECRWFYQLGVDRLFTVTTHTLIEASTKKRWVQSLGTWPALIAERLNAAFPGYGGLVYTMLFGNRINTIDAIVKMDFSDSGLIHLLVISGAQLSMIFVGLVTVMRMMRWTVWVQWGMLLGIQTGYLMFVGVDASIFRAFIMANLFYYNRFIRCCRWPAYWYVGAAAIVIAIGMPRSLISPGFWYSFLITMGLFVAVPALSGSIRGPRLLVQYMIASIVAVMSAIPIQLIQSNTVSIVSLFSNVWVSWMSGLVLVLGGIGLIWGQPIPIVSPLVGAMLHVMIQVAQEFKHPPLAIAFPFNWVLSGLIILIAGALYYRRHMIKVMIVMGISVGIYVGYLYNRTVMIAVDVGQGDATLIVDGFHTVLVDTGGQYHHNPVARQTLIPALNYWGITQLDAIIITHADTDHSGGLALMAKRGRPTIFSSPEPQHRIKQRFNFNHHVIITQPTTYALSRGHLSLIPVSFVYRDTIRNNQALVVGVSLNQHRALITGDITQEAEIALLNANMMNGRYHLLKLGHHGSRTSTSPELLQSSRPQLVWNSAGVANRYGHPHRQVRDRIDDYGIPYISTQELGTIQFDMGRTLRYSGFLQKQSFIVWDF